MYVRVCVRVWLCARDVVGRPSRRFPLSPRGMRRITLVQYLPWRSKRASPTASERHLNYCASGHAFEAISVYALRAPTVRSAALDRSRSSFFSYIVFSSMGTSSPPRLLTPSLSYCTRHLAAKLDASCMCTGRRRNHSTAPLRCRPCTDHVQQYLIFFSLFIIMRLTSERRRRMSALSPKLQRYRCTSAEKKGKRALTHTHKPSHASTHTVA